MYEITVVVYVLRHVLKVLVQIVKPSLVCVQPRERLGSDGQEDVRRWGKEQRTGQVSILRGTIIYTINTFCSMFN